MKGHDVFIFFLPETIKFVFFTLVFKFACSHVNASHCISVFSTVYPCASHTFMSVHVYYGLLMSGVMFVVCVTVQYSIYYLIVVLDCRCGTSKQARRVTFTSTE